LHGYPKFLGKSKVDTRQYKLKNCNKVEYLNYQIIEIISVIWILIPNADCAAFLQKKITQINHNFCLGFRMASGADLIMRNNRKVMEIEQR
jgi:hypothetical protein